MRVLAIISDHGLGHAGRTVPILEAFARRTGGRATVVTSVPAWFFPEGARWLEIWGLQVDVGVKEIGGLRVDHEATLAALEQHFERFDALVDEIVARARKAEPRFDCVYFDIGAAGPVVAQRLGVPSVGMSNFNWAFIYANVGGGGEREAQYARYVQLHLDAYAHTTRLLALPYSAGALAGFDKSIQQPIGFVGRRAKAERGETRRLLGLDGETRTVLGISFGAHGLDADAVRRWAVPEDFVVALLGPTYESLELAGAERVIKITPSMLADRGLEFVDCFAALDVCVGKPGWGIVSEAILNGVPLLYVDRSSFPEYPLLVEAIRDNVASAFVEIDDVRRAQAPLFATAREVCGRERVAVKHSLDGNDEVARELEEMCRRGGVSP